MEIIYAEDRTTRYEAGCYVNVPKIMSIYCTERSFVGAVCCTINLVFSVKCRKDDNKQSFVSL